MHRKHTKTVPHCSRIAAGICLLTGTGATTLLANAAAEGGQGERRALPLL